MKERREKKGLPPMQYGVAAYSIIRNTDAEVKEELERITNVRPGSAGYNNYQQWLAVLNGVWHEDGFSFDGKYYHVANNTLQPKPVSRPRPALYAGGESETAKDLISTTCDGYVMHGDTPETIGARIRDMKERREKKGLPPMQYGVAAYSIIRNTDAEVKKELERITNVRPGSAGYNNYQQWLAGTQLEQKVSLEDYSVSNRGLRTGLTGTPAQVEDRIGAFEKAGVDFFLLQCSPQLEEMERFAETVIGAPIAAG
jgi:FMNH2-dependent dimethyl sulfone monooxygenase